MGFYRLLQGQWSEGHDPKRFMNSTTDFQALFIFLYYGDCHWKLFSIPGHTTQIHSGWKWFPTPRRSYSHSSTNPTRYSKGSRLSRYFTPAESWHKKLWTPIKFTKIDIQKLRLDCKLLIKLYSLVTLVIFNTRLMWMANIFLLIILCVFC